MNKNLRYVYYAVTGLLIIFVIILAVKLLKTPKSSDESTSKGIEYISSVANKDMASVNGAVNNETQKIEPSAETTESLINTLSTENSASVEISTSKTQPLETAESIEEATTVPQKWLDQVANSNITPLSDDDLAKIRTELSNTVIVGDSMAQAFIDYGLLDDAHIFYKRGVTIDMLADKVTEAAAMYPQTVIFFTGLNDANKYENPQDYITEYMKRINEMKTLVPGVKIYVCSMLPPSDALGATRDDLVRAPMFSTYLYQMCQDNGIGYIDTYWLVNQNYYLEDGIHFKAEVYHLLLKYIAYVTGVGYFPIHG